MVSVPESSDVLLERVLARVAELEAALVERDRVIAEQGERMAELERRLVRIPRIRRVRRRRMRHGRRSLRGSARHGAGRDASPGISRVRPRRHGPWSMIRMTRW